MYTLGIETSCDETSCAVLKNYKVLSNVTISSLRQHKKYGGIIPEIATRAHLKNIDKVFNAALSEAKISLHRISVIAVTHKPGLIGSLVVGINFAKALSLALGKPLIGVNHLHAHLFAPFLNYPAKIKFPFLGLVVSGGHTEIYRVDDFNKMKIIGQTRDDACGEVFDKIGRSLGLGYPGGPIIDKLFDAKRKDEFKFKCGKIGLDLSFSGIKTAVIYKQIELEKKKLLDRKSKIGLISAFQATVVEAIVQTVVDASIKTGINRVVCGGGVIANSFLRARLSAQKERKIRLFAAPLTYSTDNAAMVAGIGFYLYNKGIKSNLSLKAEAS
ncbi:MAG: tRNA (adenosine(37)-N6)-threonylcarbamoyltransferase complex transferase subunit TsaD [Candidatus Omnitrophica bacterium]|nr:tRNA (adenosine(37)-N6)-threonylcarbamoyltransferase complex transferase subunit TsaD [Candidatus Omnitrophota bacterium]